MTTANAATLTLNCERSAARRADLTSPRKKLSSWKSLSCGIAATLIIAAVLTALPQKQQFAPVIVGDNCFLFLAADRLYEGYGLTIPPPQDPTLPWDWRCDWDFLTQWPIGFPVILCATRLLLGGSTVQAAMTLSVMCAAASLVGWFILVRRSLPNRLPGSLIAALAAGATFTIHYLVTPASDVLMLAAIPAVLLLAWPALGWSCTAEEPRQPRMSWIVVLGLAAGALVWIRYAAIFVPLGVGVLMITDWLVARRARFVHVLAYVASSVAPLVGLLMLNKYTGPDLPVEQQYPLGHRMVLQWDWSLLTTAWRRFAEQAFYQHHAWMTWVFLAALPVAAIAAPMLHRTWRTHTLAFLRSGPLRMALALTASCGLMLIGVTFAFKDRFDYVGLERYYLPIRPFYFLLFLGPIACMPWRTARALTCVPLLLCCSWYVRQDWARAYDRYLAKQGAVTDYGRRPVHFEPDSMQLYAWLTDHKSDELLVFSNFYDDISLETWIPACPAPTSPVQLQEWIARVKQARGVSDLRIVFAIDLQHHSRRNMTPTPPSWIEVFDLVPLPGAPDVITSYLYCPRSQAGRWSS